MPESRSGRPGCSTAFPAIEPNLPRRSSRRHWRKPNPSGGFPATIGRFWSCGSSVPRAKRRLGQHFLTDPRILARIADAVGANPDETVLEIGPGPGGLTSALLERAGRVIAIEKDSAMLEPLRSRYPALELVHGDALDLDWHALVGGPFIVAGN